MKKILIGLVLLIELILLIGLIPYGSAASATTYKSYVDQDYGFYRIISIGTGPAIDVHYINKTFNISIGDTVIWINDATPDWPLTIISEQGLWGNRSAYLRWNYQKFNYTFNESGVYGFYIREYPRLQHQKIIVAPVETPTSTVIPVTYVPTAIPIETEFPIETELLATPEKTPTRMIPGLEIIITIMTISLVYMLIRKYNI